jgi:hypothetical protein
MDTMTDTPETDQTMHFCFGTEDPFIPVDFARKLERERDEARVLADRLAEAIRKHQVELPFRADFCDVELYEALAAHE